MLRIRRGLSQVSTLCLMHGGRPINFELLNIPVENLIWLD
jgi:hypothetical protein